MTFLPTLDFVENVRVMQLPRYIAGASPRSRFCSTEEQRAMESSVPETLGGASSAPVLLSVMGKPRLLCICNLVLFLDFGVHQATVV